MRGLIVLAALGGAGYYLYKSGALPQAEPFLEGAFDRVRGVAEFLGPDEWGRGDDEKAAYSDDVQEASGGQIVPILGKDEVVTVNAYEGMLRKYQVELSPWARANIGWAAAICSVENGPRNPKLSGDNGTSHGVLQVKVATAETCRRAGYVKYPATKETLLTYAGGIYFGTAEMDRLSKINSDRDWIIQAYNGGAGFQQMPAKYIKDRAAYLEKVKRRFAKLYAAGTMV